ncbi:MAG: diguanylate cyclase [Rhodocyclales bacterium]|nr:diguanylate cyclase [Rhodocyclales bacterium]
MEIQSESPDKVEYGSLDFSIRLMEHLVVPTFVIDANCRVIIWNLACERLTGIKAADVIGTSDHWRGFYDTPRPCLADLIAQGRTLEIDTLYADHDHSHDDEAIAFGRSAMNWCVMPRKGTRLYLAIDAGPIYEESGKLIAVVETLRNITAQKLAEDELQLRATRDGLTGVANRRCFDEALHSEWRRASRESNVLSLLMIDVDFFKRYNDAYGHQAGDQCLRSVATAMSDAVKRSSDAVARYGGEEFAVLLPSTEAAGALIVAQRICSAVADLRLPHAESEAAGYVTVSIGVACMTVSRESLPADLVALADGALYQAKREGRNQALLAA